MRGGDERLTSRAPFTCGSFLEELDDRPAATTLYVPICAYARDDEEARLRVRDYLVGQGSDPALYEAILRGFATRPLDAGVGMQSWVAHRRYEGRARLTVYLGTEALERHAPGAVPAPTPDRTTFATAEDVIERVNAQSLGDHPFVARMKRSPDDPRPLDAMIAHLDGPGDTDLDGRASLARHLAREHRSADALQDVAALLAGEIGARQLLDALAPSLRASGRDLAADPRKIAWLAQHDAVDEGFAEAALSLARQVPGDAGAVARVQRGAEGVHNAVWRALDQLYGLCFEGREPAPAHRDGAAKAADSPRRVAPQDPIPTEVSPCNE
jgi:hypothetical protein